MKKIVHLLGSVIRKSPAATITNQHDQHLLVSFREARSAANGIGSTDRKPLRLGKIERGFIAN